MIRPDLRQDRLEHRRSQRRGGGVVSSVRVTVQPLVSSLEIRGVLIMKRLAIITSTLAAVLVAAPAFAADPIDRVPAAIPAPMPIFNWTGLYAGIHGGWVFGSANQRYTGNAAYLAGPVALVRHRRRATRLQHPVRSGRPRHRDRPVLSAPG
jgi:hypothetical protein